MIVCNELIPSIRALFKRKLYAFDTNPQSVNIIGVRTVEQEVSNRFDDFILCVWESWQRKSADDQRQMELTCEVYPATTVSGLHYFLNPINQGGTAIMMEGQYRDVYELGLHKGQYEALVQRGPIRFVRDWNRDNKIDIDVDKAFWAQNIGANIHRSHPTIISTLVGKWSAACQVLQSSKDLERLIELCKRMQESRGNNAFTYTLINSSEIEKI